MDTQVVHDVLARSQAGELTFPQVVGALLAEGVESYFIDLASGTDIVYATDGMTFIDKMTVPRPEIAGEFSAAGLVAAIRGAQADAIRYPEFVRQATAAGTTAYWAFLTGRKVVYFGRKGEMHVELFPGTK